MTIKEYLENLNKDRVTKNSKMVDVLIQIDQVYTEIERKLSIRLNHSQIQQSS